jgi:hypothetical protein
MAFTAAIISWTAGRYLYPAWLRWLLFAWCLVLLDALTIAADQGGRVRDQASYLLVGAQVNLLTFWAIMGPLGWQLRLPIVLVGMGLIFGFCHIISNHWSTQGWAFTMMLAPLIGGALCIGLRLLGFRLQSVHSSKSEPSHVALQSAQQFGLRHMFVWATAAVPLLLITRGIDLMFFRSWLDAETAFAAALLATSIATINLVAVWSVLGAGRWIARLAALLVVPVAIAAGLESYGSYVVSLYGMWANIPMLDMYINMQTEWFAWCTVSTALLAALLLFLRAGGFRVVRQSRSLSA